MTNFFSDLFSLSDIKQDDPTYLYVGEGSRLSYIDYPVETNNINGSVNLIIAGNKLTVSCNQQTTFKIKNPSIKTVSLLHNGIRKNLSFNKIGTVMSFTVPAITNAEIQIN